MVTRKLKISWESWNALEEELIAKLEKETLDCLSQIQGLEGVTFEAQSDESEGLISVGANAIITPFGDHYINSVFKPSNRWECWIGYTNFPIDEDVVRILDEEIDGIEALAILGAYTFCIGVAKMFNATEVKREIEENFCD